MVSTRKIKVHVMPAFHYDVAYKKTFKDYLPESFAVIKKALSLLKDNKDYTFCIEQVILIREYWDKYPDDRSALVQFAQAGRLYFAPGMFTMPDSNIPSGENFIRNVQLGRRWLRDNLGITQSSCCWMADIFGHNPQSPQLANICGYKSYMFERGKAGTMNTAFRWEGIDGSRINAQWELDTYYGIGSQMAWRKKLRPMKWVKERIDKSVIELLSSNSVAETELISTIGGDFRLPNQQDIDFLRELNDIDKKVDFIFSSPENYYAELEKNDIELPIEKIDLNPLKQGVWSSRIKLKQFNRLLEQRALGLELLESINSSNHDATDALWETLTWNAFHDIIAGTMIFEAYNEALEKYEKAAAASLAALNNEILKLAQQSGLKQGRDRIILAFNSLPYPIRHIIKISENDFRLVELAASSLTPIKDADVCSGIENIGVKTEQYCLENSYVKLRIGVNGTIVSLYDKEYGKELALPEDGMNNPYIQPDHGDLWVIGAAPTNAGLLRTAPHYDPKPLSASVNAIEDRIQQRAVDADCQIWPEPKIIDNHPLQGTIEIAYPEIGITTSITLKKDDKMIYFKTHFMPQGKCYRLRMGFPTAILNGKIRNSVPCGHLAREEGEYCVQNWTDLSDAEKGLLLVNRGIPGNNVTGNVMMLSLFRGVTMERQESPEYYDAGIEHIFEYGVMPFFPNDNNYSPARVAEAFNRPPSLLKLSNADTLNWRNPGSFVELKGDNAELASCRLEDDNLIIRLYESKGQLGEVMLKFKHIIKELQRCDAIMEQKSKKSLNSNLLTLKLSPFEIVTVKLKIK